MVILSYPYILQLWELGPSEKLYLGKGAKIIDEREESGPWPSDS